MAPRGTHPRFLNAFSLCIQMERLLSEAEERAATAARGHAAALDAACREKQQVSMLA